MKEKGGEFIFHHELDKEFFLRLEICEREGDILLVWVEKRVPKTIIEDFRGYFGEKLVKIFET